ncbi:Hypothetical predicted protein [Mytilus galloprovincialis]|uniref:Uncharacterized protein n=1 Tax=Mytilus galloprovincialis TaxID=29158 RepID=A0A8B6D978_MYTGA|nr:Hypothetical predicted protein [Mytilus galloprovincialis]
MSNGYYERIDSLDTCKLLSDNDLKELGISTNRKGTAFRDAVNNFVNETPPAEPMDIASRRSMAYPFLCSVSSYHAMNKSRKACNFIPSLDLMNDDIYGQTAGSDLEIVQDTIAEARKLNDTRFSLLTLIHRMKFDREKQVFMVEHCKLRKLVTDTRHKSRSNNDSPSGPSRERDERRTPYSRNERRDKTLKNRPIQGDNDFKKQ